MCELLLLGFLFNDDNSLKNADTGEVERSANWRHRYGNLNRSSHNWLRVTRILKSLGELGCVKHSRIHACLLLCV